ncbi:hypothetical protein F5883DRAFT_70172 [Diaporthe sp. PMI_573]|nr:hypothetical protein F5883DRAFT_70172 [Diaporthaceae sp. PMI_573]
MPTTAHPPGISSTVFSVFQFGGANILNNNQLHPKKLLETAQSMIQDGYDAVSGYIAQATSRAATPEEPAGPVSRPDNNHQATDTSPECDSRQGHLTHSPTSEADGSEGVASQPADGREQFSVEVPISRPKRTWMWLALLIVGVLFLVVVPGLVLGVMTGQLPWGIALSGAVATVASFFAGLYYHVSTSKTGEPPGSQASDLDV